MAKPEATHQYAFGACLITAAGVVISIWTASDRHDFGDPWFVGGLALGVLGLGIVLRTYLATRQFWPKGSQRAEKPREVVTADPIAVDYRPYWKVRSDGQLVIGLEWSSPDFGWGPTHCFVSPPDFKLSPRRAPVMSSRVTGSRQAMEVVYPEGFGVEGTAPPGQYGCIWERTDGSVIESILFDLPITELERARRNGTGAAGAASAISKLVIRAPYRPRYRGLGEDEFHRHVVVLRDCTFTNGATEPISVRVHLAQRSAAGKRFFHDDPTIPTPDGFLRNPIDIPAKQSVRGHVVLLVNELQLPFLQNPIGFGIQDREELERKINNGFEAADFALAATDLLTGEKTTVPIPTEP